MSKSPKTIDATMKIDASTPTFALAKFARELGQNEKIVRNRFRAYHANDDARFDVVRRTIRELTKNDNATKTRWVFLENDRDEIRALIVRVDDKNNA